MGPDPSLTPDLVGAQSFTTSFRGYDPGEVRSFLSRVATELRHLRERCENLESAWHSAEERAARPPVLDEDTLMAAVGEETASILRAARAAATDLRTKANEEAQKVLESARAEAERLKDEARGALARETRAAEEAAERVVSAARTEAAEAIDKARVDADQIRTKAEADRMLTIDGANATRDRILDDLARRRRVATVQIEQLRAGRERLIESYAIVRRTLEEAQSELSRADAEARKAADDVGRRLRGESEPRLSPEADIHNAFASDAPEAGDLVVVEAGPALSEPAATGDEAKASATVSEAATGVEAEANPTASPGPADTPGPTASPGPEDQPAPAAAPPGRARRRGRRATAGDNGVGESGAATTVLAEPARPTVVAEPARPTVVAEPASPATAAADPAESGSAVDELFARIRSTPEAGSAEAVPGGSAQSVEPAGSAQSAEPVGSAQPETEGDVGSEEEAVPDGDEALLQKRESAVIDLEVSLTRKLKRALQDEQNDLLDRLRGLRGEPTAARLLPAVDSQMARYTTASRPLVEQAATAGARFAADTLGTASEPPELPAVDDLSTEAAHSIVDPLRRRLEQAIDSGAGEDQAVLVETVGAAYREWKSQRIERIAGDVLAAAFSRGTWHATPGGTSVRWVVEDTDGPCPDCDDDALAGVVPKGESFPTGQHYPPAHSGCRCLLVPVGGDG
jgi:DivIVA domain-containing protein